MNPLLCVLGLSFLVCSSTPSAGESRGAESLTIVLLANEECLDCDAQAQGVLRNSGLCPPPNPLGTTCASFFGVTMEQKDGECALWLCTMKPCEFGMKVWGAANEEFCCCASPPTVNGTGAVAGIPWVSPSGTVYNPTPMGTPFGAEPMLLEAVATADCTTDGTNQAVLAVVMKCPGVVGAIATVSYNCDCIECI